MKVLIVPEDFRQDQFVLKPLFSRLLASLGKPRATVRICQNPLLGGVGEALKSERVAEIVDRYGGSVNVILLCIDRDGNPGGVNDSISSKRSSARLFLAPRRGKRSRPGCWPA